MVCAQNRRQAMTRLMANERVDCFPNSFMDRQARPRVDISRPRQNTSQIGSAASAPCGSKSLHYACEGVRAGVMLLDAFVDDVGDIADDVTA